MAFGDRKLKWKQVVSPDVLFARSRFARTESRFAQSMKSFRPDRESFRPRIENKFFFLLDLGFSLIDHIDPEKRSCQTKPDDQSFADRLIATYTHAQYVNWQPEVSPHYFFARMTRHITLHLMITLRYTICLISLHYRPGLSCRNVNLLHSA